MYALKVTNNKITVISIALQCLSPNDVLLLYVFNHPQWWCHLEPNFWFIFMPTDSSDFKFYSCLGFHHPTWFCFTSLSPLERLCLLFLLAGLFLHWCCAPVVMKCQGDGVFSNLTDKPHFSGIVTRGDTIARVPLPELLVFVFLVLSFLYPFSICNFPIIFIWNQDLCDLFFSSSTETNNQKGTAEKLPVPMRTRIHWSVSPSRVSICYEELRESFIMITLPASGQPPGNLAQIVSVRSCGLPGFQEKSSL